MKWGSDLGKIRNKLSVVRGKTKERSEALEVSGLWIFLDSLYLLRIRCYTPLGQVK